MRNKLLFILVIIAAALIQATLLDCIALVGVKPDLLLILVIICGIFFEPGWALGYSIVAGSFRDSLTSSGWGVHVVLFALLSVVLSMLHRRIRFDNRTIRISVVCASSLAFYGATGISIASGSRVPSGIFAWYVFAGAAYNTLIFACSLRWLEKVLKRFMASTASDDEDDFNPDFEANL